MTPIDFPVPPISKVVSFNGTVEQAFDRFTLGIGSWWPLRTHSLGREEQALSVGFDRLEVGGRLIEQWRDGQTRTWGTIIDLSRPERLSFTWHVGRDPDAPQVVELGFEPAGEGRTQVTLVHSGWERLGPDGAEMRGNYDEGWNLVLEKFSGDAARAA